MKIFLSIILLCSLALTAPAQRIKISAEPRTNVVMQLQDLLLIDHWLSGNTFTTRGTSASNLVALVSNKLFSVLGTNTVIRTNGATLGSAGTVNWTTGVTGSISGSVATLGISASGGGGGSSTGVVPIGAIVAWHKSLTGVPALPSEFKECDGTTISDAGSPMNGQAVPNLNGNNSFLRGNTTSIGTGGAATHVHAYAGGTDTEDGDTDVQSGSGATVAALGHIHTYGGTTDSASSLPPYQDMVWIMRIK